MIPISEYPTMDKNFNVVLFFYCFENWTYQYEFMSERLNEILTKSIKKGIITSDISKYIIYLYYNNKIYKNIHFLILEKIKLPSTISFPKVL